MRQKIKVVFILNLLFFVLIGSPFDVEAVESQALSSSESDQNMIQTSGLLGVTLLSDTNLDAAHSKLPDGRHKIILNYSGWGALDVSLLGSTFMIFQLPPEIANAMNGEIVATYDVPEITALGVDVKRKTGDFGNIELTGNQVILDFKSLISLNLLSRSIYKFSVEITMDDLPFPTTEAGKFTFYGEATKQLIDLSILSDTTPAKATISYNNIAAPVVSPVYSNHTTVSGTGEPNKKVTVEINDEFYYGNTDESGQYSVSIPVQEAGTEISVFLSDENGFKSESTKVIVLLERVLKFHNVPDILSFQTTKISSKPTYIKRDDSNWNIQVWDTRGEGSTWRLLAEATKPLISVENPSHTLPNALIYIDDYKNEYSLTNGPVEVYKGETGNEYIIPVHWSDNTGPFIYVHSSDVYAETYTTQITWTLVDAP
jgi:hypothetical protein